MISECHLSSSGHHANAYAGLHPLFLSISKWTWYHHRAQKVFHVFQTSQICCHFVTVSHAFTDILFICAYVANRISPLNLNFIFTTFPYAELYQAE